MTGPGHEIVAGGNPLPVTYADRERVIRILKAALEQGRLTEDEHDERTAQASVSRSRAELAGLTADLPAGITAVPPSVRDVRIAVGVIIAAAGVLAAVLVTNPDDMLAFMAARGSSIMKRSSGVTSTGIHHRCLRRSFTNSISELLLQTARSRPRSSDYPT